MVKLSNALPALVLAAAGCFNRVAADPTEAWFELLIDKICELTACALSADDDVLVEALVKDFLAACPGVYP
jgi:hypothetical protein